MLVNDLINALNGDTKRVSKLLSSIHKQGVKNIIILKENNTLLYTSDKKRAESGVLKVIQKSKNGFFQNSGFVAFVTNNNLAHCKVASYFLKDSRCSSGLRESLNRIYESTTQKNLLWLLAVWFLLLALSLLFSKIIYNRLKLYERQIDSENKRVIFQSRQALLGELLPMIAHQWRQPLNKIAAALMRMRFEISGGRLKPDILDIQCRSIEDSVELMSQTIDDFRSFYHPKEEPEEVDLALMIRKAIYFLDELLQRKKISIRIDLMPLEAKLHANEFLQVVINIIKNAADAVEMGGNIYISLHSLEDGLAQLRIEDDGVGIPNDKLEKIFEPHESSKQGSMGLGLYMSRLIIQKHFGGEIRAYNRAKGAGFLIIIPTNKTKR